MDFAEKIQRWSIKFSSFRRVLLSVLLLIILLLGGSVGYAAFEGWTFSESFYMTIITLSTVGFQEVHPLSPNGRMVTIVLIIVGFGTVGYGIGNLSAFFIEGELREIFRTSKMEKLMDNINEHIIICGYGSEGSHAAKELFKGDSKVLIIEKDPEIVDKLKDEGKLVICGDATQDDVLLKAGVIAAKGLIAAVSDDSENVFITLTARGFNANLTIISKAANEASIQKFLRAGANKVISSAEIGGIRMASVLLRPKIVNFLDIIMTDHELALRLEEIEIAHESHFIGNSLKDIHVRAKTGVLVIAYYREGQPMKVNPDANTILQLGDVLIVLGNETQIGKLIEIANIS